MKDIYQDDYISLDKVSITKEMGELIDKITNKIWETGSEIMPNNCTRMANAEFIMIQHHDGEIKLGDWGHIGVLSRSKASHIIRTWCNRTYSKTAIKNQVIRFVKFCANEELPIK